MTVEKVIGVTFLPRAECQDEECMFAQPPDKDTRNRAKRHAQSTGHRVMVITESRDVYARTP